MSLQSLLTDDLLMPLMPMIRQQADHPFHAMDRASRPGRRLHQLVDPPRADAGDPVDPLCGSTLDDADQRLLDHRPKADPPEGCRQSRQAARLEKAWEV